MSCVQLFHIIFIWVCFCECLAIRNYENNDKNLISEDDRRGVTVNEDARVNDLKKSEPTKRGLWLISQHQQPSDYDTSGHEYHGSSGSGGYGYVDSGAGGYGTSGGGGYSYGGLGGGHGGGYGEEYGGGYGGGYHKTPILGYGHGNGHGHGHGYSGGTNFGYGGSSYDHSAYGEMEHGMEHGISHGNEGHNKLALKKFLIPLAGLAILGAAAALSSNPVLLQLGNIHSGRRKRSASHESGRSRAYPQNPWVKPD